MARQHHPGVHAFRAGIAIALGAATIISPVIGVKGLIEPQHSARASVRNLPRAASVLPPVEFLAVPPDPEPAGVLPAEFHSPVPVELSPAEIEALRVKGEAVSVSQARAAMPDCTGNVVNPDAENGKLNVEDLCVLPWTATDGSEQGPRRLRGDAALALGRLNAEYAVVFGADLCVGDAYRSYEEQVQVKARKPGLAAAPGASNHGWALAVDLCGGIQDDHSEQWKWMVANAPKFGWDNPEWAREGGRGPHEPWHFEYVAEVAKQRAKRDAAAAAAEQSSPRTTHQASKRRTRG